VYSGTRELKRSCHWRHYLWIFKYIFELF